MKVPEKELMRDILMRVTGESALPVYSDIVKYKRAAKNGQYLVAEDYRLTAKKREMVNAKERQRVSSRPKYFWNTLLSKQCTVYSRPRL